MFFRNQVFIGMPCSFICKQIEKEVPIGTTIEETMGFVRSHEDWTNGNAYGDPYEYEIQNSGIAVYPNKFEGASFYSFCNVDYETNETETIGSYCIRVELGTTPFQPFWGRVTTAYFVFDEEQHLTDILVQKSGIGF